MDEQLSEASKTLECKTKKGSDDFSLAKAAMPSGWLPKDQDTYLEKLAKVSTDAELLDFYRSYPGSKAIIESKAKSLGC